MMSSSFVVWEAKLEKNCCTLSDLDNVEDDYELRKGFPRMNNFPDNAVYYMHPEYPKNIVLLDNLYNLNRLIVGSKALKDFLKKRDLKNIEYLPVTILNHKNRIASRDYFITHPIYPQDCLDTKRSGCTWSEIIDDEVDEVNKLVIDETKVDPEVEIFRLKYFYDPVIVKRDLAEAVIEEGFSGIRWVELDKYPER